MQHPDLGEILTGSDVADRLGVTEGTVWRMIHRGHFPRPFRIGGAERWCQRDIDACLWLAGRGLFGDQVETPDEPPAS